MTRRVRHLPTSSSGSPGLGGFTLLETLVVLLLLAMLLGMVLPPAARWRDALAVRAARDELAAALSWTRLAAAAHGGAMLELDPATGRFRVVTGAGEEREAVDLGFRYGVRIEAGTAEPVVLEYDAIGVGRVASRTVRLVRGASEAGLTISGHGRLRRW